MLPVQSYPRPVVWIQETRPALKWYSSFLTDSPLRNRDMNSSRLCEKLPICFFILVASEAATFVWVLSLAHLAVTSLPCIATTRPLYTKVLGPEGKWCT